MAQNVAITAGSGTVIAADLVTDIAGFGSGAADVQYMKLVDGTVGGTNKLVVNSVGSIQTVSPDLTASGSFSSTNSASIISPGSLNTLLIQVTGTWSQTLVVEATLDGTTYFSINANAISSGVLNSTITGNGAYLCNIAGLNAVRVRCSVYNSGTAVVTMRASVGKAAVAINQMLPVGSNVIGALTANQTVNLNQIGGNAALSTIAGVLNITGGSAAGSASVGFPVRTGGVGRTLNPIAVTDGQVSNAMTDKMGRAVVIQGHVRELIGRQSSTLTSTTAASTVVSPVTSSYTDITHLSVTNGSATATTVTLSDGSVSFIYNVSAGGGFVENFNPPLPATTLNASWTLQCGTSVASIYCNVVYVKNI